MSEKSNIARAAGVLGGATILSRIMGMIRDMVVSRLFGAGLATDAFFAAFQIPNMLRRLFAEGALTAAFVPTFSAKLSQCGSEKARELANVCFTILTIVMAAVTLAGIILSPVIVGLMFPGFSAETGKLELTTLLNRLMFPYIFFISLVALCMGVLNTLRHFFTPAISTIFLNIAMIAAAIFLRDYFAAPITALAVGVLIGGFIQLLLQLPVLWKKGFLPKPDFNFNTPEIRSMALLMIPSLFGVGVYYLNIAAGAVLASLLQQGSVSYLYYAQRLFEFPQGIFTASVAQAVLPSISRQAAEQDIDGMKETISFGVRLMFFITVPAMAGLILCATPLISLIFMGGAFDFATVSNTASALVFYSFGLAFVAITRVTVPAFYALKDTKTPVICAFIAFIANLCFSIALMGPLRHSGLALATSLSALCNMALLLWYLRRKVGSIGGGSMAMAAAKALAASLPMALAVWYINSLTDWSLPGEKLSKGIMLAVSVTGGVLLYGLTARILRAEELTEIFKVVKRKRVV